MAKLSDVFQSKYLKAETDVIEGDDKTFTIKSVEIEDFDNDGKKTQNPVLYLKGEKKGMVCNRTNSKTLAEIFNSDDTDDWEGKRIVVCSTEVQFGADMVYSLRVVKKKTIAANAPRTKPATPTAAEIEEADEAAKIPF